MFFKLSLSLLLLVTCSHLQPENAPAGRAPSLREMEGQIVRMVNTYRRSNGRPPLKLNPAMHVEADTHNPNMARGRFPLIHHGFDGRIRHLREKTVDKVHSGAM